MAQRAALMVPYITLTRAPVGAGEAHEIPEGALPGQGTTGYPPAHSPTGGSGGDVAFKDQVGPVGFGAYWTKALAAVPCGRRRAQFTAVGPTVERPAACHPFFVIQSLTQAKTLVSERCESKTTVTPIWLHPFLKYSSLHEPIQLADAVVEDTSVEPGGTACWTLVSALRMPPPGSPPECPQAAAQRAKVTITTPRSPERLISPRT